MFEYWGASFAVGEGGGEVRHVDRRSGSFGGDEEDDGDDGEGRGDVVDGGGGGGIGEE